jgi:hypothetical protein
MRGAKNTSPHRSRQFFSAQEVSRTDASFLFFAKNKTLASLRKNSLAGARRLKFFHLLRLFRSRTASAILAQWLVKGLSLSHLSREFSIFPQFLFFNCVFVFGFYF